MEVSKKKINTTITEAKTASEDDSSKLTNERPSYVSNNSAIQHTPGGCQNTMTFCKPSPVGSRGPSLTRKEQDENVPPMDALENA